MSISEQVKELKELADYWKSNGKEPSNALRQAADTIEALSAKLAKANMDRSEADCDGGWIPCSERLPNKTGSYLVTAYSEGISEYISDIDQFIYNGMPTGYWINSDNVIAWRPLPEPYTENEKQV